MHDDAAAVPAVAAVRAAAWDKFFPAKAAGAIAALPGFHKDCDLIDKCRHDSNPSEPAGYAEAAVYRIRRSLGEAVKEKGA